MGNMLRAALTFILLAFTIVAIAGACAGSSAQREKTIRATYNATSLAYDQLATIAHDHSETIIHSAKSVDEGKAQLEAWRAKIDKADKDALEVFHVIAAAAVVNDEPSFSSMLQAAALFSAEFAELKGAK